MGSVRSIETWAASGGMWLTGWPDEPPLTAPGPVIERAAGALSSLSHWTHTWGRPQAFDAAGLLFGRAALMGLTRRGRISANGSCRLLRTADGWVAVNLARADDIDSVPAIVEDELRPAQDPWDALRRFASGRESSVVVSRAQLLGVPAAGLGTRAGAQAEGLPPTRAGPPPAAIRTARAGLVTPGIHSTRAGSLGRRPVVVDLSAMWAGPLCARLLERSGADVVKVELAGRPDGARAGHRLFWRWLHEGQRFETVDPATSAGLDRLHRLVEGADVVIESSRPRALRQLGLCAESLSGDGRTWISITGYGRGPADEELVAFGDDAAVAGGLTATDRRGDPVFCGDAIADPLAGIVAAAAGARALAMDGGLVSIALADVAAWAARPSTHPGAPAPPPGTDSWIDAAIPPAPPPAWV